MHNIYKVFLLAQNNRHLESAVKGIIPFNPLRHDNLICLAVCNDIKGRKNENIFLA
jgi:hypothetical protein